MIAKKWAFAALVAALFAVTPAWGEPASKTTDDNVPAAKAPEKGASVQNSPEAAFHAAFPQITADSVSPTEIPGLYEIVSGQNIFYYYPDKDLVITGEIIGKDLKSRTAERRSAMAAQVVKTLPLDKAVRVGNGKKVVIEFTDPDCPFCKKASEFLRKRTDITRYIFFAPMAHPAAITKIHYILESANKGAALEAMMQGEEIPANAPKPSKEVKALAEEHLELAKKVGIQGTPTFFINGEQVVGADLQKLEQLLK